MYEIQAGRWLRTHHVIELFDDDGEVVQTFFQPAVIDLYRIDMYERAYEEDKDEIYTDIITHSGVPICLDITFEEFDYIYTKYVINRPHMNGISYN